jgi:hypothetical protein
VRCVLQEEHSYCFVYRSEQLHGKEHLRRGVQHNNSHFSTEYLEKLLEEVASALQQPARNGKAVIAAAGSATSSATSRAAELR